MADYREIFDRLSAVAPAIGLSTAAERVAKLRRLYKAMYELRGEIGAAGLEEIGADGRLPLLTLKTEIDYVAERLEGWMEREEVESVPALMGRRAYVHNEPKGVVLHLATWNSPILISFAPVVSMIAAGNAVVIKPSEVAPISAELVKKVVEHANLDQEVAVVIGGPETAQALLTLPFNHICYVGNNRIGRLIMEAAAKHFTGVTLEMGGKNPVIVEADADLEDAAAKIAFARQMLAGQACLCPDYALVQERVMPAFLTALQAKTRAFFDPEGKGFDTSPDLPRIINERHVRRIKGLIDDAVAKGAHIFMGGTVDEARRFVAPTIIKGITAEMEMFQEEIFGPVIAVQSFTKPEEALAEIAKRPKPLGLYVFTSSRHTAEWYLRRTRAGSGVLNNLLFQAVTPSLPFGGANHSGIGRLNGQAGFREFSNPRGIVEDALQPTEGPPMFYPPFPSQMMDFIEQMLVPQ